MHLDTATLSLVFGVLATTARADNFANFFDDKFCQINGGIGVDLNNNGCLNEQGRGSVYIPNDASTLGRGLCTFTGPDCSGQLLGDPWDFTSTGFCQQLNTPGAVSYRFIELDNTGASRSYLCTPI